MNTSSQKTVNNLGTFYTNLGKTTNQAINNVKNSLKNVNSLIPLNNSKTSNNGFFSGLSPAAATANSANSGKTRLAWPLIIFILVSILFVVIFLKFKDQITAAINNLGQKIRDTFNKPSSPLEDASNPKPATVNGPPVSPQEEKALESQMQQPKDIIDKIIPMGNPEVFNVSKNEFTSEDAEPLCRALGAELATYEQVKDAWSKGADWCNYGWVKGQAAVYPTQEDSWKRIQAGPEENKNSCGMPGVNGGYFDNPDLQFGVNCYGSKPTQSEHDQELLMRKGNIPKTVPLLKIDQKMEEYKKQANDLGILPFNENKWDQ
uniref:Link domain-containing protein n=1 Tax=viral metagenome TaxID=1070528 RepID=A0A6C0D6Z6_9ZZZZ